MCDENSLVALAAQLMPSFSSFAQDILEEATDIKGRANLLFEKKEYDDAIVQYTEVLGVLPARTAKRHDDEVDDGGERDQSIEGPRESIRDAAIVEKVRILRAVVYANIAACHLAKKEYKEAVVACNESLQDDPIYLKALNRRAQANEEIGTWSSLTSSLEGEHDYDGKSGLHANTSPIPRLQGDEQYATTRLSRAGTDGCIEATPWKGCCRQ
jgi:tetratricopeptide (TPR) repeat protein